MVNHTPPVDWIDAAARKKKAQIKFAIIRAKQLRKENLATPKVVLTKDTDADDWNGNLLLSELSGPPCVEAEKFDKTIDQTIDEAFEEIKRDNINLHESK